MEGAEPGRGATPLVKILCRIHCHQERLLTALALTVHGSSESMPVRSNA